MLKILNIIFGDPNKRVIEHLRKDVERVNLFEPEIRALSDDALKAKTQEFRGRLTKGESLEEIVFEAFAVAREAARRTLNQRHFDVQLMGGFVLHRRGIAEMRTGEGKTLTATAPLYANALVGKGCHLVTVNDYLASRDAVWMGQVFYALGITVGVITHEGGFLYDPSLKHSEGTAEAEQHDKERDEAGAFLVHHDYLRPVLRREAYAADITYGTNNEFGFDYLRDNMVPTLDQCVMRGLHFAIVDEVDSILIDEARTPLIISAPAEESNEIYQKFAGIARSLRENEDYNLDEKMRTASFTAAGIEKVEKALGVENMYAAGSNLQYYADTALRAHSLYKRDVHYIVKDGEIVIVDEFTGRLMPGRRYAEGIHQAIEAKEGVRVQNESQTLATITFQNYFRMYTKLAGMTGTAATEAEEFGKIYDLEVTSVPTNKPNKRVDLSDRVFKNEIGKFKAVIREVKERHENGQPILIGTTSIEKNEMLGVLLEREGIPFSMLNAKNHEKEAETIAQAGRKGAVTLATNMAGRGVDIVLGGNPPDVARADEICSIGGLHVIGTERHESRRIDNQLRGRSGRQGDPGSTQFYESMEDDLMRIFGSDRTRRMMDRLGIPDDMPIEHKMVSNSIEKAQQRVEGQNFDIRKHLLEYDDVLNKHREVIYRRRREALEALGRSPSEPTGEALDRSPSEPTGEAAAGDDPTVLRGVILEIIESEVERAVFFHTGEALNMPGQTESSGDWNKKEILEIVNTIISLTEARRVALDPFFFAPTKDKMRLAEMRTALIEAIMNEIRAAYNDLETRFQDRKQLRTVERGAMLQAMDILWIDHLAAIGALRIGIGLSGYAQRDPLVEYKKESYEMFQRLLASINQEIAFTFFKLATRAADMRAAEQAAIGGSLFKRAANPSPFQGEGKEGLPSPYSKVGRNNPCPCGALKTDGTPKKYKHCHGA